MKTWKWFTLLALVVMVSGCGSGGGDDTSTPPVSKEAKITSLSPESVVVGSAALTLTITGKNFSPASIVKVDGTIRADAVIVDASTIIIPVTAEDIATVGEKSISVGAATTTLTVKQKPWITAPAAEARSIVVKDSLLYAAYFKDGDTFLCRFDTDGEKLSIGGKADILVSTSAGSDYSHGLVVFGGHAYVLIVRSGDESAFAGFGEGFLVNIDLETGAVKEDIVMLGGQLTGFTTDDIGAIYIAFNFHGQFGEYKSAVVGVNAADATVIFEQGWTESPRISSVAVDGTSLYMGGVVTNGSGGQSRLYVRKVLRNTGAFQWESQVDLVSANQNNDMMYANSFVLNKASDALYFSGVLGESTDTQKGILLRIKASSLDGEFVWGYATPNSMGYVCSPLYADDAGSLYSFGWSGYVARRDAATPSTLFWEKPIPSYGYAILAADEVVYISGGEKITRWLKDTAATIE